MLMRSLHLSEYAAASSAVRHLNSDSLEGRISGCSSGSFEVSGIAQNIAISDLFHVLDRTGFSTICEAVRVRGGSVTMAPFVRSENIKLRHQIRLRSIASPAHLRVCDAWLGRVVDPFGQPIDFRGPLHLGSVNQPTRSQPPHAIGRGRLGHAVDVGVKVLNIFTPCRLGQRIGIFAAAGVGKSTLSAMLARNVKTDVTVIILVGERGKEVREFLEDDLGLEGLKRSVLVVATSDTSAMFRREAAYAGMTIAEYFRDQGKSVLLLMDSVTRFCAALREIASSAGEPAISRGYPASVFAELPRLFERAGPGYQRESKGGSISAFFTVLVEGDDHDEPVADAVRGLLDGHIVLRRGIGENGRYPAVDVIRSLSRNSAVCLSSSQFDLAQRARRIVSVYEEAFDLIRFGVYRPGSDVKIDEAIALVPRLEAMLSQKPEEDYSIDRSFYALEELLGKVVS